MFRTEKVKCDYKIDTMVDWFHFEALKCGTAEGQWNIVVSGRRDLGGAALVVTGNGTVTLAKQGSLWAGPWNASYVINLEGVPASIGGQSGDISGDAVLDSSTLRLAGLVATGEFWSQNPYASLSGSADPLKNLDLPVVNDQFC